jgi:hypothetical protein
MEGVRAGQKGKSREERIGYSLNHWVRIFVLTLLNEGVYSPEEMAEIIGERRTAIYHHIRELHAADSIELAETRKRRNTDEHFYRAIEMPYYTEEEFMRLSVEERQEIIGLTLQCMFAEALCSYSTGKMHSDPQVWTAWRWFNVDEQGREDIADAQEGLWKRVQEIEVESTNRCAESGEQTESRVVAALGFSRARTAPRPPVQADRHG